MGACILWGIVIVIKKQESHVWFKYLEKLFGVNIPQKIETQD